MSATEIRTYFFRDFLDEQTFSLFEFEADLKKRFEGLSAADFARAVAREALAAQVQTQEYARVCENAYEDAKISNAYGDAIARHAQELQPVFESFEVQADIALQAAEKEKGLFAVLRDIAGHLSALQVRMFLAPLVSDSPQLVRFERAPRFSTQALDVLREVLLTQPFCFIPKDLGCNAFIAAMIQRDTALCSKLLFCVEKQSLLSDFLSICRVSQKVDKKNTRVGHSSVASAALEWFVGSDAFEDVDEVFNYSKEVRSSIGIAALGQWSARAKHKALASAIDVLFMETYMRAYDTQMCLAVIEAEDVDAVNLMVPPEIEDTRHAEHMWSTLFKALIKAPTNRFVAKTLLRLLDYPYVQNYLETFGFFDAALQSNKTLFVNVFLEQPWFIPPESSLQIAWDYSASDCFSLLLMNPRTFPGMVRIKDASSLPHLLEVCRRAERMVLIDLPNDPSLKFSESALKSYDEEVAKALLLRSQIVNRGQCLAKRFQKVLHEMIEADT